MAGRTSTLCRYRGGKAVLLTPGQFEVEDISLTLDRKSILFASNQEDIDRRHIWTVSSAGGPPKPLTRGTGIEVSPVQAGQFVATLRSDERTPLRPAQLETNGDLRDIAPELIPVTYPGAKFLKPEQVVVPRRRWVAASWPTVPALWSARRQTSSRARVLSRRLAARDAAWLPHDAVLLERLRNESIPRQPRVHRALRQLP